MPDTRKFPEPPTWATYITDRADQFKMHKSLAQAKNALSGRPQRGRVQTRDGDWPLEGGWVYQWDHDLAEWMLFAIVDPGTYKSDHPLWKTKEKKMSRPPTKKAIDDALAVIRRAHRPQAEEA